jgi:uncharacterized membrane protein
MQNKLIIFLLFTALSQAFLFPVSSHALFSIFGSRYKSVKPVNGEVVIPLKNINDGKAHYYSLKEQNSSIRFFVVKSKDNVLRAAFDACDVCFPEKKGYSQAGDYMICNNCGQKFHSNQINVLKGGCNPAPLMRKIVGINLVITVSAIRSGISYF